MRGLGTKTVEIRQAIKEILTEIQPATVRAVCYRLFVRKLIPEMSRLQTDKVGRQLVALREESIIPWQWVVDETRAAESPPREEDELNLLADRKTQIAALLGV